MITKERLVNLINQEATIWWDGHFEIKLNPIQYSVEKAYDGKIVLWYQPKDEPSGYDWGWELKDLREDVDRAKWEYDMYTTRTERFEPPMWEDFSYYEFQFINYENGHARKIIFEVLKKQDNKAKTGGHISILNSTLLKDIYEVETPTKENYEKACEMVRDLFKGKK